MLPETLTEINVSITYPPEMLPSPDDGEKAEVIVVCPMCRGERQVGVIPSRRDKPPELADCPRCAGVGAVELKAREP